MTSSKIGRPASPAQIILRTLFVCIAICAPPLAGQQQAPTEPSVASGSEALSPAEAEATEARLRAQLRTEPGSASLYGQLGAALAAQGRHQEALVAYNEAVELEPSDSELLAQFGALQLMLEEWGGAEATYDAAIRSAGATAPFYEGLGDALLGQGRIGEAAEAFRQASLLNPDDAALTGKAEDAREIADQESVVRRSGAAVVGAVRSAFVAAAAAVLTISGMVLALAVAMGVVSLAFFLPAALLRGRSR